MLSARGLILLGMTAMGPQVVYAFDPFTIAKGAEVASTLLGGMNRLDEAADVGFAFSDLVTELDVDPRSEESITVAVRRLEELNSQLAEFKQIKNETKSLLDPELNRAKSFADQIRRVRHMISASKRIATLLGLRPKAAANALQLQQTRLNYMMLDEMTGLRRLQSEQLVKERETQVRYRLAAAKINDEENGLEAKARAR